MEGSSVVVGRDDSQADLAVQGRGDLLGAG